MRICALRVHDVPHLEVVEQVVERVGKGLEERDGTVAGGLGPGEVGWEGRGVGGGEGEEVMALEEGAGDEVGGEGRVELGGRGDVLEDERDVVR